MTPVPTRALAALWHAMDQAIEGMERAQEIENVSHEYDPDCNCEQCPEVEEIDRNVGEIVVNAALNFRKACEGVQSPIANTS